MFVAALVTLVVVGAGSYMVGQRSGQASATKNAPAVASVNGTNISKTDLYDRLVATGGTQTLDGMIQEKLVEQAAKDAGVSVTADEIDKQIAKIRDNLGGQDQLQQAMDSQGVTMDALKQNITMNLLMTKVMNKDTKTDDASLQKYFQDNLKKFDERQVHAQQIVTKTIEEAKAAKAEVDKGTDFATVAKAMSQDSSKDNGGDLGFVPRGQMEGMWDDIAFNTPVNQVAQPLQMTDGFHVIKVLEVKGSAPTFEANKDKVKDAMLQDTVQQKGQEWLDGLKAKAKITNTLAPKTDAGTTAK
jgi:foldase protein PrsA